MTFYKSFKSFLLEEGLQRIIVTISELQPSDAVITEYPIPGDLT